VLHLVIEPKQEAHEDDDFEDDELDLSQPVAELGQRVEMAALHDKSPFLSGGEMWMYRTVPLLGTSCFYSSPNFSSISPHR
jgi:hypothetical protein